MGPTILRSIAAGIAVLYVFFASMAWAQDYPLRPIKIIIPLGPGGGGDIFSRALADELQKAWGQPVVVENRPGGGQNIGARACAEAPPDGYTICVLSSEPVIYNQFLFKSIPYDPVKDFEPVGALFFNTLALVVNSSLKVKTIEELVALSKAKPGTLSYGTFAFPLAYFMEKLKRETGADIVRVPFRGGGEVVNAVLSGSTPVAVLALSNMVPQLQSGRIYRSGRDEQGALAPVPGHSDIGRGPWGRALSTHVVWAVHAGWNAARHRRQAGRRTVPHCRAARFPAAHVLRSRRRAGFRAAWGFCPIYRRGSEVRRTDRAGVRAAAGMILARRFGIGPRRQPPQSPAPQRKSPGLVGPGLRPPVKAGWRVCPPAISSCLPICSSGRRERCCR